MPVKTGSASRETTQGLCPSGLLFHMEVLSDPSLEKGHMAMLNLHIFSPELHSLVGSGKSLCRALCSESPP